MRWEGKQSVRMMWVKEVGAPYCYCQAPSLSLSLSLFQCSSLGRGPKRALLASAVDPPHHWRQCLLHQPHVHSSREEGEGIGLVAQCTCVYCLFLYCLPSQSGMQCTCRSGIIATGQHA